jgi:hypothetical protein
MRGSTTGELPISLGDHHVRRAPLCRRGRHPHAGTGTPCTDLSCRDLFACTHAHDIMHRNMQYVVSASQNTKTPFHAKGPLWKKNMRTSGMNDKAMKKFA